MAKNKLIELLRLPDKGISNTAGTKGVISRLWRNILFDLDMNVLMWSKLMNEYLMDRRNRIPNNRRDMASIQGNLTKELQRPEMTWKVFCKGLRLLRVVKFDIAIKLYRSNRQVSIHQITVNLYDQESMEEMSKDELGEEIHDNVQRTAPSNNKTD